MDPMDNINNAADALRQVAERAGAFYDDADAQLAERQAAYAVLANNLAVTAQQQSYFVATLDINEGNPTNVRGGTFSDLATLIAASSRFSKLSIQVVGGTEVFITDDIDFNNRNVEFVKDGAGGNPTLTFVPSEDGVENYLPGFTLRSLASVQFVNVNVRLPIAAPDPNLPWSISRRAAVRGLGGTFFSVRMVGGFSTGGAGFSIGTVSVNNAGIASVAVRDSTVSGNHNFVVDNVEGIALIATSNVTLVGAAGINEAGTLGTNLLKV